MGIPGLAFREFLETQNYNKSGKCEIIIDCNCFSFETLYNLKINACIKQDIALKVLVNSTYGIFPVRGKICREVDETDVEDQPKNKKRDRQNSDILIIKRLKETDDFSEDYEDESQYNSKKRDRCDTIDTLNTKRLKETDDYFEDNEDESQHNSKKRDRRDKLQKD